MFRESKSEKPEPETYDCESCRAVVNVDLNGRRRDERGWLCSACFNAGRPTVAETDAALANPEAIRERWAALRQNRGET